MPTTPLEMKETERPTISAASVKVMRSYDYCHFEVCLSIERWTDGVTFRSITPADIDEVRKTAARLADKAVNQYKAFKENLENNEREEWRIAALEERHEAILAKAEPDRTPEEQAIVKAIADRKFELRRYDYDDAWQEPEYGDEG